MDLPVGSPVEEGLKSSQVDFEKYLNALVSKQFSGYVVITIEGYSGMEEGILFLKKGAISGAFFEYNRFGIEVFGDSALEQFFNAIKALHGIIDIFALTPQQIDLITAFHDKVLLLKPFNAKNLNKLIPSKYDTSFAQKTLSQILRNEDSKYDVLKKLGLSELKSS